MFRCKKANGEKFLRPLTIRCLFQNQASLANAFGAFFFGVPNYCNTLILTDIHGHTQNRKSLFGRLIGAINND